MTISEYASSNELSKTAGTSLKYNEYLVPNIANPPIFQLGLHPSFSPVYV
jgi:hypothetical protein